MRQIAITGHDGLIGISLVKRLRKKKDIRVKLFDRKKYSLEEPGSLLGFVGGADVIVHLAGVSNAKDPGIMKVNVLGFFNLLKAIEIKGKCPLIIFPSTVGLYEASRPGVLLRESSKVIIRNEYCLSKLLCEEMLKYFAEKKVVSALVLRVANVYGEKAKPYGHSVIATCKDLAVKDAPIVVDGDGKQTRDFIYVEDVVRAMDLAVTKKSWSRNFEVCNLATQKETSIMELIKAIEKIQKNTIKIERKPATKSSVGYWRVSNRKAKALLKWEPKVGLGEGLKKVWQKN